jgi:hypothetical protein
MSGRPAQEQERREPDPEPGSKREEPGDSEFAYVRSHEDFEAEDDSPDD